MLSKHTRDNADNTTTEMPRYICNKHVRKVTIRFEYLDKRLCGLYARGKVVPLLGGRKLGEFLCLVTEVIRLLIFHLFFLFFFIIFVLTDYH